MSTALMVSRPKPGACGLLIVAKAMPLANIPGIIDNSVPTAS